MTIEEYLEGVNRIYYQLSVIVEGKQLLADGNNLFLEGKAECLADIRGSSQVRFTNLSIPTTTKIDKFGRDYAVINYGGVRLVIWPTKEVE